MWWFAQVALAQGVVESVVVEQVILDGGAVAGVIDVVEAVAEPAAEEVLPPPVAHRHGFRMGYAYVPVMKDPDEQHLFVMGYELQQRAAGGAGLDILFVQNVMVTGLNQSLFLPSANLLIGASIHDRVQFGVGPNLAVVPELSTNLITAVGFEVPAGRFDIPVHVSWVSARDDWGRVAVTTGVNWGRRDD